MSLKLPFAPDLSAERSSAIKQIRASFETQLASQSTSIEEWLTSVGENERSSLLLELLDAEIRFLRQQGKSADIDAYNSRFPDEREIVRAVFVFHGLATGPMIGDPLAEPTVTMLAPVSEIAEPEAWAAGERVGRYQLNEFIGAGGFGQVWKAFDPDLGRYVAIKLAQQRSALGANVARAFQQEARKAASLRDSGIVPVYDIGTTDKGTFIVSEFVEGPTLSQRMKMSPLPVDEAVRIVILIAKTLHQAHLAGLFHRDVKPSNILLRSDGTPAITDFGLAVSETEQQEEKSQILGTPMYMSPEQARGESRRIDGRSDLYSVGVILFQLLTGRGPYQYKNRTELLDQIVNREVRPLRSINDKIPAELDTICRKCLAKDLSQRYSTGADLAADLQQYLERQKKRRPPFVAVGIASAGVALVAALLLLMPGLIGGPHGDTSQQDQSAATLPPAVGIQHNQWLSMLDQPLEQITTIQGDALDSWDHSSEKKTLNLRSDLNPWLIATPWRGQVPLRIQGRLSLDAWLGNVGYFWGLNEPGISFPEKPLICYAVTIERYQPADPVRLVLREFQVGETISSIRYIRQTAELASTEIKTPARPDLALEISVVGSEVKVQINGDLVWTTVSRDHVVESAMRTSSGITGFVGRGKTVAFRDAAVMFQTEN